MLYFIFVWTILLTLCCIVGTGLLHFLRASAFQRTGDQFVTSVWLGVVCLSVLYLLVSLVLPLSSLIGFSIAIACCGLALLNRSVRSELAVLKAAVSPNIGLLYLIGAMLIAALSTRSVTWLDTGLYHYPLIHWLNQVGTVPGIALLFANFGFTSSWFAFAAPLNPEMLNARASAATGGFALFVTLIQTGIAAGYILRKQAQFSDWFLGFFSAILLLCLIGSGHLREISISPSPDIPVAVLTGVIAWTILVITNTSLKQPATVERVERNVPDSSLVTLILATGTVTVKLVALPLLAISCGFYLVRNRTSLRRLVDGLAAVILVFSPFLLVQVFTSGCPLFPSSALCFSTPWSVPVETKEWVTRLTHNWTSWYTSSPQETTPLPVALWLWLTDNRGNQIMALIAIGSLVAFGLLFRMLRKTSLRGYLWIIAIQVLGIAFYLKTSPLLRFALPCLILIPALLGATFCYLKFSQVPATPVTPPNQFKPNPLLLGLLGIAAVVSVSVASAWVVLPPPMQTASIAQKQVNNVTYFAPEKPEVCWSAEIPCAFEVPDDIYLRNPNRGFVAGFIRAQ
ncbi:MAG: hypothetical protein HC827_13845 [Cyanobacteria bacterium RM1_2_2]|nr:hypothetical protein [Cyanobacteria bacterium RM1_2_2]